jgi:DNA-binding SARP family transcriptional activator
MAGAPPDGAVTPAFAGTGMLTIRLLGEMELLRGGVRLPLPPSKKTRALLAYLLVTGRPHRRERLCSLLWEIPDDPRGALRWSLSRLRPLVDEPDRKRIIADRDTVGFDASDVGVDMFEAARIIDASPANASTSELARTLGEMRGEFLEGLDLPDYYDFRMWCVGERERARAMQIALARELLARNADRPEEALPFARILVRADPFDAGAHARFIRLLGRTGRTREAAEHREAAQRLGEEIGADGMREIDAAWAEVAAGAVERTRLDRPDLPTAEATVRPHAPKPAEQGADSGLVGRHAERRTLAAALEQIVAERRQRGILLLGEPGIGKSRLLDEMVELVRRRRGTVLSGSAYEVERSRPYGPWIDALRRLPAGSVGGALAPDLAPLLPELGRAPEEEQSRDRLFGAVVEVLAARAHSAPPVLLALDDVHWLDDASGALLHYVVRLSRHRPLLVLLAAREGELADNPSAAAVIRSLRREGLVDEMSIEPLDREQTRFLVETVAPGVDVDRIHAESGGNTLFAIELARALGHGGDDLPRTLGELVRERIGRLPQAARDVLRWGAVLGHSFDVNRIATLMDAGIEQMMSALEILERHALVRATSQSADGLPACEFVHDLVRRAVYAGLSEPRRQLMHGRIAKALEADAAARDFVSADIAHHASLAGQSATAARACAAAAGRSLRVFANHEAEAFARRGMRHAAQLSDPERTQLMLELYRVQLGARRPDDLDSVERTLGELAERALDLGCLEHARLGFHLLSWLRWERGYPAHAEREIMRAELVSQSADPRERVAGLAEAAKCLALLERDLPRASAMLAEAEALSRRLGVEPHAIADAAGMLARHEGRTQASIARFERARLLARAAGDRLSEFQALEHLAMVHIDEGHWDTVARLAEELDRLGTRLRDGSEAPFARALVALARHGLGEEAAVPALEQALDELRDVDAKYRLAYVLTRTAQIDLDRNDAETARRRAEEALQLARTLDRATEIALALVALARASAALGDTAAERRWRRELASVDQTAISAKAREKAAFFSIPRTRIARMEGPNAARRH